MALAPGSALPIGSIGRCRIHLVAMRPGRRGSGGQIVGVGQERQRHRYRQLDGAPRHGRRRPHIVDDDGQHGAPAGPKVIALRAAAPA